MPQEVRAEAAAAALAAATTPEAKAEAEAAAKEAEEKAAAELKQALEEDAKVGDPAEGVLGLGQVGTSARLGGRAWSGAAAALLPGRRRATASTCQVRQASPTPSHTAPYRTAPQVDYVAEALKQYSIIQENQWNKGEM